MSDEWQQVKEIFNAALRQEPGERRAFIEKACGDDDTLRREVDSLLSSYSEADSFLEQPAVSEVADMVLEDSRLAEGARLNHYRIISRLGAGGMGEVYLAEDTRLGRRVALKVLPAATGTDKEANQRLRREARAAATLDHPNICAIHEIAEADGLSFIVMQYIVGETLAARLKREKMSPRDVVGIAVQIADALAEAHMRGVIHRDIKPANIIVNDKGLAKVLDFGLAKFAAETFEATSRATTAGQLSESGAIMGTIPYMSPEQVRGKRLDSRTDIFSFGATLYEMLCGRSSFARETEAETISAILRDEPSLTEIPRELRPVVQKCLMKDADERYRTAKDLSADLRELQKRLEAETGTSPAPENSAVRPSSRNLTDAQTIKTQNRPTLSGKKLITGIIRHKSVSIAALIILLAGVGVSGYWLFTNRPASTSRIDSIAVLPLDNLSGDPAQEYFADGMTEALISNLARIRALKVISRTSIMRYRGSQKSLPEIARELNVDAVIEGSVQRSGGRVRVAVQLIYAATDAHLWARDYERNLTDVLKLQSEVARAVADEIHIQITAEERARLAAARRVDPQAHEAYLLGMHHLNKNNEQDWTQAIGYFERAIQLDPDYAAAYAGLSNAWQQIGIFGMKPFKEVEPPARNAALKAIGLDEQLAEAHTSLADIMHFYDWDWAGAEAEFKRALELDPGNIDAHVGYGTLLMHLGRHDEAVREGRIAVQLDPISARSQTSLGRFLYRARRYEEALPHLQRAVELEPRSIGANFRLGDVYVQLGRYDEAIAVFKEGRQLTRDDRTFQGGIARVYALMGRHGEARQMIRDVKAAPILVAGVYAALGDRDEAFKILEKAIEERNSLLVVLKEDPPLENLHSDPRWKDLLRRMNFPPE